jgi:hypothetical protein
MPIRILRIVVNLCMLFTCTIWFLLRVGYLSYTSKPHRQRNFTGIRAWIHFFAIVIASIFSPVIYVFAMIVYAISRLLKDKKWLRRFYGSLISRETIYLACYSCFISGSMFLWSIDTHGSRCDKSRVDFYMLSVKLVGNDVFIRHLVEGGHNDKVMAHKRHTSIF